MVVNKFVQLLSKSNPFFLLNSNMQSLLQHSASMVPFSLSKYWNILVGSLKNKLLSSLVVAFHKGVMAITQNSIRSHCVSVKFPRSSVGAELINPSTPKI